MAWRSVATTNRGLVQDLVDGKLLQTTAVIAAFCAIDRGWFLPVDRGMLHDASRPYRVMPDAYHDCPQPIGHGATISAPHMHAMMAERLYRSVEGEGGLEGKRVLDVGSGSGFLTAVLGKLVGPSGRVVGIEHVPELVADARASMRRFFPELTDVVSFDTGDGRNWLGDSADDQVDESARPPAENESFDLIHVGAAAAKIPANLVRLLRPRGRMVIPLGEERGSQALYLVDKRDDGEITIERDCGVIFVPLTSLDHQLHRG